MLTASKEGRNLILRIDGVEEPFSIPPLPGNAGRQITATYLVLTGGDGNAADLADTLRMAVDGAALDDAGLYKPRPASEQVNYTRAGAELSQEETENVLLAAFTWQTALGMDGVRRFIEAGEGTVGAFAIISTLMGRARALNARNSRTTSETETEA